MLGDEITKEILIELHDSLQSGDKERIEKAKYKALLDCNNLFEIVSNYLFLNRIGISFDFGTDTIYKDKKLYRIRKFEENVDYADDSQWTAPPCRPQNRANKSGQEALYLGSTELVCLLETHIEKGQKYVIATYECVKDIRLGGFFTLNKLYGEHNVAGFALNAFLIAPSRSDKNKAIFNYLDSKYPDVNLSNLTDWKNTVDLSFKFAVLNKRNEYYKLTNAICDILQKQNNEGIRYSSCYIPIETLGIECTDYNIVLYNEGIKKIKFLSSEIKTNEQKFTDLDMVKIYSEVADKCKRGNYDET